MNLRTSTVAGICFFLGGLMFFLPIAAFDIDYDGIDNDRMSWSCDSPIFGINPPNVDLDDIRTALVDLPPAEDLESEHPDCRKMARAQIILGLIAAAAGIWKTRVWWRQTADERAEKKFQKLQDMGSGKSKGLLG